MKYHNVNHGTWIVPLPRLLVTAAVFSAFVALVGSTSIAATSPPLTGLELWLDGADLDGDGTPNNVTQSDPVTLWVDRIGGLEFSKVPTGEQPEVSTLNGVQAVLFDGSDSLFEVDSGRIGGAGWLSDQQGTFVLVSNVPNDQSIQGYAFAATKNASDSLNVDVIDAGIGGGNIGGLTLQAAGPGDLTEGGGTIIGTGSNWTTASSDGADWVFTDNGAGPTAEFVIGNAGQGTWFGDTTGHTRLAVGASFTADALPTASNPITGTIAEILDHQPHDVMLELFNAILGSANLSSTESKNSSSLSDTSMAEPSRE